MVAAQLSQVREIVMRHGWNATAYQILNPGFDYWFDPAADAVAGFVRERKWWVVAGAPVCALADLDVVVARLEAAAATEGCNVVFVCAADRMRRLAVSHPKHSIATLGAEPVWSPPDWVRRMPSQKSFRAQLNRARNKRVVVERTPVPLIEKDRDAMRDCLAKWLVNRKLPPLHFMVEPNTIDGIMLDRRVWMARRAGEAVGFLLASPVPARKGYLIEQIIRLPDAPNGTAELMIDTAIRAMADEQCAYVTLGMVVLSGHSGPGMDENPRWLRGLFHFARAHGRRFYNFRGLERFREKLTPDEWEPLFLITNTEKFTMAGLYAAGAAFCGNRTPTNLVSAAIFKAIRTEAKWAGAWLRGEMQK